MAGASQKGAERASGLRRKGEAPVWSRAGGLPFGHAEIRSRFSFANQDSLGINTAAGSDDLMTVSERSAARVFITRTGSKVVLDLFQFTVDNRPIMQLDFWPQERTLIVRDVHHRLLGRFGKPGPWFHPDPLSQLVLGLVGGRTPEAVSLAAYRDLVRKFASWTALRDAPVEDIRAVIGRVTFAEVKAVRLRQALQQVTERRGRLTLDFLQTLDPASAMGWLMQLPGVGPKTAAVTLNFSTLRMRALVIDTHHLRVVRRLRLVPDRARFEQAFDQLMSQLPAEWGPGDIDDHHQLMKRLGQTTCHHGNPQCGHCPLFSLCPSRAPTPVTDPAFPRQKSMVKDYCCENP